MSSRIATFISPVALLLFSGCGGGGGGGGGGAVTTWTQWSAGIQGATVHAIQVTAAAIYLGTDRDGIYRSIDGGTTWQSMSNGMPDLLPQVNEPLLGKARCSPLQSIP